MTKHSRTSESNMRGPYNTYLRPEVRFIDSDTGEIKCRAARGRDPVIWSEHAPSNPTGAPQFRGEFDEWEMSALEMALQLVPDLETAIDRALMQGMSLEVVVSVKGDTDGVR